MVKLFFFSLFITVNITGIAPSMNHIHTYMRRLCPLFSICKNGDHTTIFASTVKTKTARINYILNRYDFIACFTVYICAIIWLINVRTEEKDSATKYTEKYVKLITKKTKTFFINTFPFLFSCVWKLNISPLN